MEPTKNQNFGGQKREQSIELLRIILMTLIVFGHFIGFGNHSRSNPDGTLNYCVYLSPLYLYHVDAFVFISGYYGIKLKWRKWGLLIIKMVLYSLVAIGLAIAIMPDFQLTPSNVLYNVYPISTCDWWFMAEYLFLMLMSPIINSGMEKLNRGQQTVLVIVLYISWFRCTYVLLLFVYILGRFLRQYPCQFIEKRAGSIFIISIAMFFVLHWCLMNNNIYIEKLYKYMSPFIITPAVALFYVFKRMHLQWNRGVELIASGVLAAYLITTHELPRQIFNEIVYEKVKGNILLLLVISLIVVILCALIDILLTWLLNLVLRGYTKI